MSYTSFADADLVYQCAISRDIQYHAVDYELFNRFWDASCQLKTAAGATHDDELVRQLLRGISVRFQFAATPLPFNHSTAISRLEELGFDSIVRKVSRVYPSIGSASDEVLRLLRALTSSESSPLLDCLDRLVGAFGSGGVVIRDSRLDRACREVIKMRPSLVECEVVNLDELRTGRTFSRLFLFGPTSWLPEYVFSAPRAREIHVITYRRLLRHWQPRRLFLSPAVVPSISISRPELSPPLEEWPEPDWEDIAQRALKNSSEASKQGHELVEARLFLLKGGLGVFLDVSDRSTALIIDPEADGDARVRRILADEIQSGSFLLLRTEGGGDYIVQLADEILSERAKTYRDMQRHWKDRLREVMAHSEEPEINLRLLEISVRLLDLGAVHAEENNVRYWLSPRSISPRELVDFRAIMELIGLEEETYKYWACMRQILAAHHHAGRRIRRSLIERISMIDLSQVGRGGRFDITLPDKEGGRFTAFLVEDRSRELVRVSPSRDGRVFDL